MNVDELERLHREATPGPWDGRGVESYLDMIGFGGTGATYEANVNLIVHLRNHLPEIISRLKAADAMREAWENGDLGDCALMQRAVDAYDAASRPISATSEVVSTERLRDGATS